MFGGSFYHPLKFYGVANDEFTSKCFSLVADLLTCHLAAKALYQNFAPRCQELIMDGKVASAEAHRLRKQRPETKEVFRTGQED